MAIFAQINQINVSLAAENGGSSGGGFSIESLVHGLTQELDLQMN